LDYLSNIPELDLEDVEGMRAAIVEARTSTEDHPVPDCALLVREYAIEVIDAIDHLYEEMVAGNVERAEASVTQVAIALRNFVTEVERVDPEIGALLHEFFSGMIELAATAQPTPTRRASFQSLPPTGVPRQSSRCPGSNFTCEQLTCSQAYACLAAGNSSLDRDNDGVPCESVCIGG